VVEVGVAVAVAVAVAVEAEGRLLCSPSPPRSGEEDTRDGYWTDDDDENAAVVSCGDTAKVSFVGLL
jgi:hypothetical protein